MKDNRLLSGSDVTVRADGCIVGGVKYAEIVENNKIIEINEFLSGVPAARIDNPVYRISLRLDSAGLDEVCGGSETELAFENGEESLIFEGCKVKSVKRIIAPDKTVEYTVTLEGYKRRFEDGN